jgi:CheY-like chemotaxis protein
VNSESPRKRVLIVDDDASVRDLLHSVLSNHDLIADCAADGAEAIELLKEHHYSVVLLDLLMPKVDGFSLLNRMAESQFLSHPVVLVITGAERNAIDALDPQRIHGIVRKPFEPEELASLVVACAEVRQRNTFGAMAIATMVAGGPIIALLNRLGS